MNESNELQVDMSTCGREDDDEGSQDNEVDSDGGTGALDGDVGNEDASDSIEELKSRIWKVPRLCATTGDDDGD